MATDIVVPTLGESVTEATVAQWFKKVGDAVKEDEPVVELETDKVTLEVGAPADGVIKEIKAEEGDDVEVGAVLGSVEAGEAPAKSDDAGDGDGEAGGETDGDAKTEAPDEASSDEASSDEASEDKSSDDKPAETERASGEDDSGELSPAVRKLVAEHDLDPAEIDGSGKDGRLTKGDVLAHLEAGGDDAKAAAKDDKPAAKTQEKPKREAPKREAGEREERVKMSRLRQRIAERLKEAQNTAAMLTTFNEIDMTNVMASRNAYKDAFEKKHGVKLGFMSYFVKACVVALQEFPAVNAEIEGDEIVYKNYYDIGVAVGTGQGLVVPVVRDCEGKSFAEIEQSIADLGQRAQDGKLSIDELTGGTFSITNGGIFGNLLSTPILNPPQSGILGMHKIQDRPMAIDGEVVIRPMMYIALSYDHRIIDGREAVTFLRRVKECVEAPERILLDM